MMLCCASMPRNKEAGSQPPERDAPFRSIAAQKEAFTAAGCPIISVATKKKELMGDFKNAGPLWCQRPLEVNVHDFPGDALGRAVPYGLYDLQHNEGAVSVGMSADPRSLPSPRSGRGGRTVGVWCTPGARPS
jgi:hypothetical protein